VVEFSVWGTTFITTAGCLCEGNPGLAEEWAVNTIRVV